MVWTNFEFCQCEVTRIAGLAYFSPTNSTESAFSIVIGGTSSVPGSMFQASYCFRQVLEELKLVAAGFWSNQLVGFGK